MKKSNNKVPTYQYAPLKGVKSQLDLTPNFPCTIHRLTARGPARRLADLNSYAEHLASNGWFVSPRHDGDTLQFFWRFPYLDDELLLKFNDMFRDLCLLQESAEFEYISHTNSHSLSRLSSILLSKKFGRKRSFEITTPASLGRLTDFWHHSRCDLIRSCRLPNDIAEKFLFDRFGNGVPLIATGLVVAKRTPNSFKSKKSSVNAVANVKGHHHEDQRGG